VPVTSSPFSARLLRTQSDERLVAFSLEGHALAFELIVERYRRPLQAYISRIVPDGRAEDVLQQTFLNAWSSLSKGNEVRELKPWLYGVARNAALNALRLKGYDYAELREALQEDGPESEFERLAAVRETLRGVALLPERQREALLRLALGGSSEVEVAEMFGVSEGAVRQLVFRARQTLRAAATAVTPVPVARWALGGGRGDGAVSERIAELAGAAGSAGAVTATAKTAALVAGCALGVGVLSGVVETPLKAQERHGGDRDAVPAGERKPDARSADEGARGRSGDPDDASSSRGRDRPRKRPERTARDPQPRRVGATGGDAGGPNYGATEPVERRDAGGDRDGTGDDADGGSTTPDGDATDGGSPDSNVNSNENLNENLNQDSNESPNQTPSDNHNSGDPD